MAANQKILKALRSALTHLKGSLSALKKSNDDSLMNNVWHVGAELEYALFLISMTPHDEKDKAKWSTNPDLKKVETGTVLVKVQDFVSEAEKNVTDEKLAIAHKNVHVARSHILKIQKELYRKKREAFKKR